VLESITTRTKRNHWVPGLPRPMVYCTQQFGDKDIGLTIQYMMQSKLAVTPHAVKLMSI